MTARSSTRTAHRVGSSRTKARPTCRRGTYRASWPATRIRATPCCRACTSPCRCGLRRTIRAAPAAPEHVAERARGRAEPALLRAEAALRNRSLVPDEPLRRSADERDDPSSPRRPLVAKPAWWRFRARSEQRRADGLVGVPWQDVSSEASWTDERALAVPLGGRPRRQATLDRDARRHGEPWRADRHPHGRVRAAAPRAPAPNAPAAARREHRLAERHHQHEPDQRSRAAGRIPARRPPVRLHLPARDTHPLHHRQLGRLRLQRRRKRREQPALRRRDEHDRRHASRRQGVPRAARARRAPGHRQSGRRDQHLREKHQRPGHARDRSAGRRVSAFPRWTRSSNSCARRSRPAA